QPRPLPFSTHRYPADPGEPSVGWAAVAGGRLYARRVIGRTVRVTAYTTTEPGEPAALRGVPAADWPDAGRLAPGAQAGDDPSAADRTVSLGTTTLHDLVCAVKAAGLTTVETAWVAASPKQAHALLTGTTAAATPHVDGADEAFSGGSSEFLWIRVGRYIE